jgi:tRNA/tmRNA/rRNA uracil-C5-methylase (TrmA/RlmC/RlmD family)
LDVISNNYKSNTYGRGGTTTSTSGNNYRINQNRFDFLIEDDDDRDFYQVVVPSDVTKWRTQAKLVVTSKGNSQWTRDGCEFGLYRRGTHDVIPIPNCEVHHPAINRAVQILEQATKTVGTVATNSNNVNNGGGSMSSSGNDRAGGQGQGQGQYQSGLRFVQLQVERTTNKIQLVLVWSASQLKEAQPMLTRLIKEIQKIDPTMWHSIWCNCNDGPGNNIFSRNPRNWHHLAGPEFVREPLPVGNVGWLYFSPLCFRQGNLDGFDIIANDVARAVPSGSKVCELYAGVGLLGLTSLSYHHNNVNEDGTKEPLVWVRCSDENPANPRCFSRSVGSLSPEMTRHDAGRDSPSTSQNTKKELTLAKIMEKMKAGEEIFENNPPRTGPKATYMVASAGAALRAGQALGANVLIVDPPRKGLDDDVLGELCKPINPRQPMVESPDMLAVDDNLVHWTNDVKTLIYVSCGFDAFTRDCEQLLSSPAGWKLESATGYVLFPGSNHVETLCIFQRP